MDFTTTELVAKLKLASMVPTSQITFTTDDFLRFLNDEMLHYVVPLIMSVREEYFVTSETETIGSLSTFDIPERAIGIKLRDVLYVTGGSEYSLARFEPEDIEEFNNINYVKQAFYLENDNIKIKGIYNSTDYLKLKYFRKPNELVATSECALVSSVVGNVATCSSIPTTWTTSMLYDVIKGKRHFSSKGDDQTVTDINFTTNQITFQSIPSNVVAGDWICLNGESPVAQIPYDAYPILIMKTAGSVLRSLGNDKDADRKELKAQEMEKSLIGLLKDRTEGEPRKLINTNNMALDRNGYWGGVNA